MLKAEYAEAEKKAEPNIHIFSDVIAKYYTQTPNLYRQRFYWVLEELNCSGELLNLSVKVFNEMNGHADITGITTTVILQKGKTSDGKSPTEEVVKDCCDAFASYVYTMLHE